MKLKPLGKKLAFYKELTVLSLMASVVCFFCGWASAALLCVAICVLAGVRAWGIAMDGNCSQYGLLGFRQGPNPFVEYEPCDPEYENERIWQDRG